MKQPLLKYALSLWLTACLLAGISVWSGQAHAQTRKIDRVLQTLKLKKKESSTKPTRKPKGNRDGADVTGASEPLMERRAPRAGRLLPNKNRANKPTRQPKSKAGGGNVTGTGAPRMERNTPQAGRPIPDKNRVYKPVRQPKRIRSGAKVIRAEEPNMEIRMPEVGQPLPKSNKHYQPELNSKKTLGIKRRAPRQQEVFEGNRKVKKNQIREPGTHYTERKETVGQQYSSYPAGDFAGHQKVKKSSIPQPGTHHSERKTGAGLDAQGPTYSGHQKVKKSSIAEPGKGQKKSRRAIERQQQRTGTGFSGFFRKKKRDIHVPGTQHDERPASLSRQYANSNQAANYEGSQKIRKNQIREPGTHYTERKMGRSASQSNMAANHPGSMRVKKKHLKEPGTHYTERKMGLAGQYSSTAATNFQGHLKGSSKRERSRFYEKQSKKVQQYEGNIKVKLNKENMHPSHLARSAKRMRSAEQVEQYRSFSKWWTRLWQKDQPEAVKKKPEKLRYDKKEKDIWEDSRNW